MVALQRFFDSGFPSDIEQFFNSMANPFRYPFKENSGGYVSTPKIDLTESSNGYVLIAEVPGFNKEDLSLEFIDECTLKIEGHSDKHDEKCIKNASCNEKKLISEICTRTDDKDDAKKSPYFTYWCKERSSGYFCRKITLPTTVDKDHIKANLKNGLLCVDIPKSASSKSKKITIN